MSVTLVAISPPLPPPAANAGVTPVPAPAAANAAMAADRNLAVPGAGRGEDAASAADGDNETSQRAAAYVAAELHRERVRAVLMMILPPAPLGPTSDSGMVTSPNSSRATW